MIKKNKIKFTHSVDKNEFEPGDKNRLMQLAEFYYDEHYESQKTQAAIIASIVIDAYKKNLDKFALVKRLQKEKVGLAEDTSFQLIKIAEEILLENIKVTTGDDKQQAEAALKSLRTQEAHLIEFASATETWCHNIVGTAWYHKDIHIGEWVQKLTKTFPVAAKIADSFKMGKYTKRYQADAFGNLKEVKVAIVTDNAANTDVPHENENLEKFSLRDSSLF